MLLIFYLINIIFISEANSVAVITGNSTILRSDVEPKGYGIWTKINIHYGPIGVGDSAFRECYYLEVIDISLSVTTFSSNALRRCNRLKEINVPSQHPTLYSDEQHALYNSEKTEIIHCPSTLTSFIIPNGVHVVKSFCFTGNNFDILNIPSSIIKFEHQSFNEAKIRELTYSPNSTQTVFQGSAIRYCSITKVHIPPSIITLESFSFDHSGTKEVIFDEIKNSNLSILKSNCFYEFTGNNITLPQGIAELPSKCFNSCPNLQYINIPRNCEYIHEEAFAGCKSITKITVDEGNQKFTIMNEAVVSKDGSSLYFLPNTMETLTINKELINISITALQFNSNLMNIEINGSTKFSARDGVLYDYDNLTLITICGGRTNATIKSSVRTINAKAFFGTKLTNIVFESEENLTTFGEDSFKDCLLNEIKIPKSVSTIQGSCFKGCSKLENVVFDDECEIREIGTRCFETSGLVSINLPKNLRSIPYECFLNCKNLVKAILPKDNALSSLAYAAFKQCNQLITLENFVNIQIIEVDAFDGCSSLEFSFEKTDKLETIGKKAFSKTNCTKIVFGSSLQSIDNMAFSECPYLETVEFSQNSPIENLGSSAFIDCPFLCSVKLSKNISIIDFSTFSGCWKLTHVDTDQNDHFHFENGILYNKNKQEVALCLPGITDCNILSSASSFAPNSFTGCKKIKRVEFESNDKLLSIGELMFFGCSALESILIPDSVESLGKSIFSGCTSLRSMPFGPQSSLHTLPESCFSNCGFVSIQIPPNINILSSNCFSGSKNLKEVTIGSSITRISTGCFADCPSIRRFLFCGKENVCDGSVFDIDVEVFVTILYRDDQFGTSAVSRVLDPVCSEITAEGITDDVCLFCAYSLFSEEG